MKINELYEIIRREGACLWVGSACSVYAGYPNVGGLKEMLNAHLKNILLQELDTNKSLREFSEDFVTLTSRKELTGCLQRIFSKTPSSTAFHDKLAQIPHFHTIITTNYDKLLEGSFQNSIVVTTNSDVSKVNKQEVVIYKIHGDIDDAQSIVITESDYVSMHNRAFKDPLWASIIHEIASQNMLFFGYGYEDDNIKADFEHVYEKLADKKKKRFMIGRSASDLKLKKLKQRDIEYVICDAENFVDGFIKHFKSFVVSDMRNKLISESLGKRFIHSFNKKTVLDSSISGMEAIHITSQNGISNQELQFKITDPAVIADFNAYSNSYDVPEFTFKAEHLAEFNHLMEGFLVNDLHNIEALSVITSATLSGHCKLEFPDQDDFEISLVDYEFFNDIPGKSRLNLDLHGFKVKMDFVSVGDGSVDVSLQLTEPLVPTKIKYYCEVFNSVIWFLSGERVRYTAGSNATVENKLPLPIDHGDFSDYLKFYNKLRDIERVFKVSLPWIPIGSVTTADEKRVNYLQRLIREKQAAFKDLNYEMTIDLPKDVNVIDRLRNGIPKDTLLVVERRGPKYYELFSTKLLLVDEQISLLQPMVKSHDSLKNTAVLVPKDGLVIFRYSCTGFEKTPNKDVLWTINKDQ